MWQGPFRFDEAWKSRSKQGFPALTGAIIRDVWKLWCVFFNVKLKCKMWSFLFLVTTEYMSWVFLTLYLWSVWKILGFFFKFTKKINTFNLNSWGSEACHSLLRTQGIWAIECPHFEISSSLGGPSSALKTSGAEAMQSLDRASELAMKCLPRVSFPIGLLWIEEGKTTWTLFLDQDLLSFREDCSFWLFYKPFNCSQTFTAATAQQG